MADRSVRGNKSFVFQAGLVLSVLVFFVLYFKTDFIYLINDDWGLYDLLSGAYLGYPDAHVSFMECPMSVLICALYRLVPGLPWYGIFLEGCILLTALLLCWKNPLMFPVWLAIASPVIMRPQYTTVAGVLMAASVFLLLKKDRNSIETFFSIALVILGEWIRPEMLLLFGAFIVPVCLLYGITSKNVVKEYRRLLFPGMVMVTIIILTLISSMIFYRSPEWREFRRIDRMRVAMADYYGYPDYGLHEKELEAAGIDREHLELISSGTMYVGRDLNAGQWNLMKELAKEDSRSQNPVSARLSRMPSEFAKLLTDRNIRPITIAAILIAIFACLSGGTKEVIICAASFALSYSLLAFRGRVLDRVQLPLLSMFICSAAAYLFCGSLIEKSRRFRITACVFAVIMLMPSFMSYASVRSHRGETAEELETWAGIRSFCEDHPGNLYLLTAGSYTLYYYQERAFTVLPMGSENFIYLGSGHMMNPNTTKKLDDLGYEDVLSDSMDPENGIYYLFEKGTMDPGSSLFAYLKAVPEKVDTFTSGGHEFEVYSLRAG